MIKRCKICGRKLIDYKSGYCSACKNKPIDRLVRETSDYIDESKERVIDVFDDVSLKFSDSELNSTLNKYKDRAKKVYTNEKEFINLLDKFQTIIYCIPGIGPYMMDIKYLILMVYSYIKKEYTVVPKRTIISIICGLLYVVCLIDLIPDVLPGIGYIDDLAVIVLILKNVSLDIKEYKAWFKENKKEYI